MVGRWERRLTLTGAGLGLALVLGAFSLAVTAAVTRSASDWRHDPLRLWMAALGAAPYALAIAATLLAADRPAVRAAMLLAIVLPAAAAALITYLVLMPPFVLLAIAATVAVRRSFSGPLRALALPALAAVTITAAWFASFLAMFATEDERCRTFADGGWTCQSDVVTAPEALAAFALLAVAGLSAALVLWPRASGGPRANAAV